MTPLLNRRIIVGITGGIAAYKSAYLVRSLKKLGAQVRVIMTESAKAFIAPLTLQALSGEVVRDSLLDEAAEAGMGHIELARWAEWIVIAPASANVISELAHGSASHLLTTVCLASNARKIICPAMNMHMWQNAFVQSNMLQLKHHGFEVIGPDSGEQACGDVGLGRMSEVEDIIAYLLPAAQVDCLQGQKVLITLGPTREYIDPVRYISNESSGKMGYTLAVAAANAGASVTIIAGPTQLIFDEKFNVHQVVSAQEMFDTVLTLIDKTDVFISTAAVSDYRISEPQTQKMKKQQHEMQLQLAQNPDIVAHVGNNHLCPFVVGFAAETEHLEDYAKAKLVKKGLDVIIANLVGIEGNGFNSDENEVTMFCATGEDKFFQKKAKKALAIELVEVIAQKMRKKKNAESTTENIG